MIFYSSRIAYWLERMGLEPGSVWTGLDPKLCPRYLGRVLRLKAYATRHRAEAWLERHWAWREWLPSNWLAVAICESGHNPPNWSHDSGTYVSAFGIYRAGYVDDAHRIGNLSWDETIRELGRLPTPREQYDAALSHYREHGDGWGCPGP